MNMKKKWGYRRSKFFRNADQKRGFWVERPWDMGEDGFTLIELIITMIIISILIAIASLQFGQWTRKANVEKETKELYTDIMNVRVMAMTRARNNGIRLISATQYTTLDDSNNNSNYDAGEVSPNSKTLGNTMNWNGGGTDITFDSRGLTTNWGTISITPNTVGASYDCIVISMTRINMGLMTGVACAQK